MKTPQRNQLANGRIKEPIGRARKILRGFQHLHQLRIDLRRFASGERFVHAGHRRRLPSVQARMQAVEFRQHRARVFGGDLVRQAPD